MNIIKSFKRWWRRFTNKTRPFPPFCPECGEEIPKGKGVIFAVFPQFNRLDRGK